MNMGQNGQLIKKPAKALKTGYFTLKKPFLC